MGCSSSKGTSNNEDSQKKWLDAEERAKADEAKAAEAASGSEADPDAAKPPAAAKEVLFDDRPYKLLPTLPMTLERLQEALVGALRVDAKQLKTIRRFWKALDLGDALPLEPLQLSVHGDGSALELAVHVNAEHLLSMIPAFLNLAPEARPSPPGARSEAPARPARQLEPDQAFCALPPDEAELPLEAPGRPVRQLQLDAQMWMAPPEVDAPVGVVVSSGERPRGKAKAKSRVIKDVPSTPVMPSSPVIPEVAAAAPATAPTSTESGPTIATSAQMPDMRPQEEPNTPSEHSADAVGIGMDGPEPHAQVLLSSQYAIAKGVEQTQVARPVEDDTPVPDAPRLPDVDVGLAASQWRETLTRAIKELGSSRAVLWLHLGGLGLPNGVSRPVDVGVRLPYAAGPSHTFRIVHPYQDVIESFEEVGVNEEQGWMVQEMGCSFFVHGPLVMFTVNPAVNGQSKPKPRCDKLLQKVAPSSLTTALQSFAYGAGLEMSIRAGLTDGDVQLGARFQLADQWRGKIGTASGKSTKDLQSMAVDLALGKEKIFDAFMVERTRQMFASMGADTWVSAIECRANDMALVTLSVSPVESTGKMQT